VSSFNAVNATLTISLVRRSRLKADMASQPLHSGIENVHEDDVGCPAGPDRDGFQPANGNPACHVFE
jgi:hypothetical protein